MCKKLFPLSNSGTDWSRLLEDILSPLDEDVDDLTEALTICCLAPPLCMSVHEILLCLR